MQLGTDHERRRFRANPPRPRGPSREEPQGTRDSALDSGYSGRELRYRIRDSVLGIQKLKAARPSNRNLVCGLIAPRRICLLTLRPVMTATLRLDIHHLIH